MPVFRHDPVSCPMCAYKLDASSTADDGEARAPEPGDLTICMRCTSILQYVEGGLDEVNAKTRADIDDADWQRLELAARQAEHMPGRKAHMILDTVVTRGPNVYHAAVTMKNGLFLVSPAQSTRKKAVRLLRRARSEEMLVVRWAQIDDVPNPGVYGMVFLSMFGQNYAVAPYAGPYASAEEGKRDLIAKGKELAERLGIRVRGILEHDSSKTPPDRRN